MFADVRKLQTLRAKRQNCQATIDWNLQLRKNTQLQVVLGRCMAKHKKTLLQVLRGTSDSMYLSTSYAIC